ncbi:AcrR family transcriptional regulator [Mumia flava]|uniref:AcrR family transcriptional regulator n=1 Tax=Mumia flava TaxID=1348852 RepID=A0A2M9BGP3_9ACTN|nr:TetR/AcrR family transcriptional regulator [Mumia flava]PJJ57074.1 AcrR family transcriptional regulator [Mumia flava]
MSESASDLRRRRTAELIIGCAQDLAEERGLDGFTMDDVAEAAGVSRRTLFNHVAGKYDAVLGAPPKPNPARLDEFRTGGPTGHLGDDVKVVIIDLLNAQNVDPEALDRVRRLIRSDARLQHEMHKKFAVVAEFFTAAILEREGPDYPALHAQAAAQVILAVFDLALDAFVQDPTTRLVDYYLAAFDGASALFARPTS